MTEEARQRIDELRREKKGALLRNTLLIFTSVSTVVMTLVLWFVVAQLKSDATVYVQEAQKTVKTACNAAEDQGALPAAVKEDCVAAQRNELPQQLQSVVQGPQGVTGSTGNRGEQGQKGDKGDKGDPGEQGPVGPAGPVGQDGVPGLLGPTGDTGAQGSQGDPGTSGPQGEPGVAGPAGPQGPQGIPGQPGPTCPDGYAPGTYHYLGSDGIDNTGDEQEWIICVKTG